MAKGDASIQVVVNLKPCMTWVDWAEAPVFGADGRELKCKGLLSGDGGVQVHFEPVGKNPFANVTPPPCDCAASPEGATVGEWERLDRLRHSARSDWERLRVTRPEAAAEALGQANAYQSERDRHPWPCGKGGV